MDFLGATVAPMAASLIALMASLLIQPVVSLMLNAITRKGQEGGFLPLFALPLMMRVLGKGFRRAERGYNNMDNFFSSAPSFKHYQGY